MCLYKTEKKLQKNLAKSLAVIHKTPTFASAFERERHYE